MGACSRELGVPCTTVHGGSNKHVYKDQQRHPLFIPGREMRARGIRLRKSIRVRVVATELVFAQLHKNSCNETLVIKRKRKTAIKAKEKETVASCRAMFEIITRKSTQCSKKKKKHAYRTQC